MTNETDASTDAGTEAPEGDRLAAWVPHGDETHDDLIAVVRSLQRELLRRRDESLGARADLATLQAKWEEVAEGDLAEALKRIDEVEDQKQLIEADLDRVLKRIDELEEQNESLRQEAASAAVLHQRTLDALRTAEQELEQVRNSTTWKVGSLAMAPVRKLSRRAGR